ncbi:MAG: hypothetical protein JSV86_13630 [Gemmatimonadota bacterium]|nr:MAG: hypothetical protein JSV86_13630 [Gemmatimonadota bacterium]
MTADRATFIPDILEEHLEELAFLWGQRQRALRDPDYTLRSFSDLEERIQAHLQGVLVVGDQSLPLLEEGLSSDDELVVFASALSLLHSRVPSSAAHVFDAFRNAQGNKLVGLRQALSHGPIDHLQAQIGPLPLSSALPVAVAAAEALAFHSALRATAPEIERFVANEEPEVRMNGWRLAGYLGLALDPKTYAAAVRDEGRSVRRAALEAGAWCGEPGILAVGRKLAESPAVDDLDPLWLLAVLGGPDDLGRMTAIARARELGPARFRLVGAYGHPALMDDLLEVLTDPDPATAYVAAVAFSKITGYDIESDSRATLLPEDGTEPDEFDAEFLDEVMLPDPERAHAHWDSVKGGLGGAQRICRGFDLRGGLDRDQFASLDMESRWEVCLRARYCGAWNGSPLSLEVFPQRR